eukprot:TRINITY_DN76_c0_g2_i1.p2 TRINITY_DN76_c0_g2~~TRINITY_DN76_c0_g2_i1.p2  ORF type:complete len:473 (+),score=59.47 TRINITY_DN76_c0_g2_i1:4723-6141(+)
MTNQFNGSPGDWITGQLATNTTQVFPTTKRQLLSNCSAGLARSLPDIADEVIKVLNGWPKSVDRVLLVPYGSGPPQEVTSASGLMAYLSGVVEIEWKKGATYPTKEELFKRVQLQAEEYGSVEFFPHHQSLPGILYCHPPLPPSQPGCFARLLNFFSPASNIDRILLQAFACTLVWGGTPGSRPIFIFSHESRTGSNVAGRETGRGISKSTTVALLSSLVGGIVDCGSDTDIGTLETRLLSAGARGKRVVRIDNVKTERLSSAGLERISTAPEISGRKLYAGEGSRPNHMTFTITMNGVSVSDDLASRSVLINLSRPTEFRSTWQRQVQQFIERHRWEIIAEIISILNQPVQCELVGHRRHAEWEAEVLGRQPDAQCAMNSIQERRDAINGETETVQAILDEINNRTIENSQYPNRISVVQMTHIMLNATGERYAANKLKTVVMRLEIPGLNHRRQGTGVFYEWTCPSVCIR